MIYTHVLNRGGRGVKSPLDALDDSVRMTPLRREASPHVPRPLRGGSALSLYPADVCGISPSNHLRQPPNPWAIQRALPPLRLLVPMILLQPDR